MSLFSGKTGIKRRDMYCFQNQMHLHLDKTR